MHINNWVHASDLMKMVKSANSASTLSSEEGLPDNHVITIRERELTVDFPELIQNNIKTDTVTLDLDAEWDGIQPVIIFGPNADGTIAVEYTGEPVHIPGAVMQYVGGLDCSVMGLDDSGEVRLVTKAAPNTFEVVESGEYIGQISEDDVSLLGQILSAIKDAETATNDASSAAEAATAASDSANTAATKATNAANSANTAATKATNAANSANTASERAENAYDVLTPIIAEIGVNGNQPRATTNPNYIATATDAYAAKPLEICIKGETRQNLWVNPSGTYGGITATSNADGSIAISGTSTMSGPITVETSPIYTLRPNAQYILSIDKTLSTKGYFAINEFDVNGSRVAYHNIGAGSSNASTTFTTSSNLSYFTTVFYVSGNDATISGTYRVMLNEGSEPAPWCPPGLNSVDELSLVTAGKNLLPSFTPVQGGSGGLIATENGDGSFHITGTTDYAYVNPLNTVSVKLIPGDYTLSGNLSPTSGSNNLYVQVFIDGTYIVASSKGTKVRIKEPGIYRFSITCGGAGVTFDGDLYPQLELGSTATAYEPPNVTTTPINLNGNTLCSLPDGTRDELTIDGTGAVTLTKRTQTIQLDGDGTWGKNKVPFVHYTSPWSVYGGLPSGYSSHNNFVDKLPASADVANGLYSASTNGELAYLREPTFASDAAGIKEWMGTNKPIAIIPLLEPQTISLPPVTLPTLPSPNITVYHDSDVPSDITVEYVQDINIVLDNLNAKIAALNIAQSISS